MLCSRCECLYPNLVFVSLISINQDRPHIDRDNPQFYQLKNGGVCQLRDYCASEPDGAGHVSTLASVPFGGCGAGKITVSLVGIFLAVLRFLGCI